MNTRNCCTLIVALLVSAPVILHASGSYTARAPRPPSARESGHSADKDQKAKYEQGKKIFSGKARLSQQPGVDAAKQEAKLRELQIRLPESAAKSTNLPSLAGKLTAEQLDALDYYVNHRYPIK